MRVDLRSKNFRDVIIVSRCSIESLLCRNLQKDHIGDLFEKYSLQLEKESTHAFQLPVRVLRNFHNTYF